ncbi:hypothetical protein FB451DRAFT_36954 [Mycena latifolia]|nr:hypothetical protein FB451DRAFT_36954 [Mycena latifolia]
MQEVALSYPFHPFNSLTFVLAQKFHVLTQSYELLLDPLRRLELDGKLRLKAAHDEWFQTYDNKRNNMVTELEERGQEGENGPAAGRGYPVAGDGEDQG